MAGNLIIIILVITDDHLHTPMYFFLSNLSCLESCYSSSILPLMLANLSKGGQGTISVTGCMVQYYFFGFLAASECYLLAAMSYDRYVAICKPLLYGTLMNNQVCLYLAAGSWISGSLAIDITIHLMHQLQFCNSSEINHFFCDFNPILKLSCNDDTYVIALLSVFLAALCSLPPFLLTLASYVSIISAIVRIPSSTGRKKAFSTCSAHLIVVSIFYGSIMIVYMLPKMEALQDLNKDFSLFYTVLTPLFNPLIYSLRNREQIQNRTNTTNVATFILLGFGDHPELQALLFLAFLTIYTITMAVNLILVLLVVADPHLHTPMYFFLGNLSCLEMCYTSTLLPHLLFSLWTRDRSILVNGCLVQYYFYGVLLSTECYLLAVMSYDRYLAICKPLHYTSLMSGKFCFGLISGSWMSGLVSNTIITCLEAQLSFCGPHEVEHFFCDLAPVLKLSCSNTHTVELATFILAIMDTIAPFLLTLISYTCIITNILQIRSKAMRQKAFSICSSHLIVVTLFFGSLITVYIIPKDNTLKELHQTFSLFYTVLTPMDNIPNIAVLASGGGSRAMVALYGTLVELKKYNLLDCVMYLGAVSGSTWCLSALYKDNNWAEKIEVLEKQHCANIVHGQWEVEKATKAVLEATEDKCYSLTDFWSYFLVHKLLNQLDETEFSAHGEACENGKNPYPIYAAVDKESYLKHHEGTWFEFTPHEIGIPGLGAYIDARHFGSVFENGQLVEKRKEKNICYLQGLWGSALGSEEEVLNNVTGALQNFLKRDRSADSPSTDSELEDQKFKTLLGGYQSVLDLKLSESLDGRGADEQFDHLENILENSSQSYKLLKQIRQTWFSADAETRKQDYMRLSQALDADFGGFSDHTRQVFHTLLRKTFSCLLNWTWGTTHNFLYRCGKFPLTSKPIVSLIDAGLTINAAYPSVLCPERQVKLIISFDYSAGDPFLTLRNTIEYCKAYGIPFPTIDERDLEDMDNPSDCYIFRGENAPTVIHCPLFNNVNCPGKIAEYIEQFSTFKMSYSEEEIDKLLTAAKTNVANVQQKILEEIERSVGSPSRKA
ncbi:hypothetical protein JRQ81_005499 [Phrynocephalus forsythii]|uniref:PLA2c domain-containing protein n=1 Tax=Phrynocephalus forsythii TaxID=171643 RepID=A0A9Q0XJN7_9SAUR|nr:hypothetical protein JRQ81_005499 [Phrynocephalus forsythii]